VHWDIHPSVVIGLAGLGGLYVYWGGLRAPRRQVAGFTAALVVMFAALNGPLHDLSDHSLFSAHMVQHLGLTLAFTPLLLYGTPAWVLRPLLRPRWVMALSRVLTRPLVAGGTPLPYPDDDSVHDVTSEGQLAYMVFDLLHLDGWDLTGARLEDRKDALRLLLESAGAKAEPVRYSDHVIGGGPDFFTEACRLGLEGTISKRRDAPYRGTRGSDWLKIKCLKQQEVVIGGYTEPEGSRIGIGALLTGVYEDGQLVYTGKVGTGFNDRTLRDLKKRLTPLEQTACPFATRPIGVGRPHWVKPELVAEVTFSEWTADGRMRHPSFQALRDDKPATAVVRELPLSVAEAVASRPRSKKGKAAGREPRARRTAPAAR